MSSQATLPALKQGDRVIYAPPADDCNPPATTDDAAATSHLPAAAVLPGSYSGRAGTVFKALPGEGMVSVRFDDVKWRVGGTVCTIVRGAKSAAAKVPLPHVRLLAPLEAAAAAALEAGPDAALQLASFPALQVRLPPYDTNGRPERYRRRDFEPYAAFPERSVREFVDAAVRGSREAGAAVGSMVGMAIADAVGAPLEFLPAVDVPFSFTKGPGQRAHGWKSGSLKYTNENNRFALKRGQWTDDSAMGFCMADTLLAMRGFDGADMRVRFHCWWNHGYNNAFLRDYDWAWAADGPLPHSVGLGGNISQSIRLPEWEVPAPVYAADTQDAGNGSLMRLAPIPVFYAADPAKVRAFAALSSRTTHPGELAAMACELLAFLTAAAISKPPVLGPGPGRAGGAGMTVKQWMDEQADAFTAALDREGKTAGQWPTLRRLIAAAEPATSTELCWNWRSDSLQVNN